MIEINRSYPNGAFEAKGNYSDFLEQRDAALHAQANYEASLANRVRREVEKLEAERQRVFELHRSGVYSDTDFIYQKSVINQQINQKYSLVNENRIEEFNMEEALTYAFDFVRNTTKKWLAFEYPERVRFQKMIFDGNVDFDGKKFKFLYTAHATAEEIQGEEIFKKGDSEKFWDYKAEDNSYLSLGINDKAGERMDFYGRIVRNDSVWIE